MSSLFAQRLSKGLPILSYAFASLSFMLGTLLMRIIPPILDDYWQYARNGKPFPALTDWVFESAWLLSWTWLVPLLLLVVILRAEPRGPALLAGTGMLLSVLLFLVIFVATGLVLPACPIIPHMSGPTP